MGIFFHSEVNGIISWVSGGEELKHLLGLLPTPSQSRIGLADCFGGGSLKVIIGPPKKYLQKTQLPKGTGIFSDFAGKPGTC